MKVIIYGKDNCPNCAKTKMLCQIKSLDFDYQTVGSDISVDDLTGKIGHPTTSLPQIFIAVGAAITYIGGYDELRASV